MKTDNDILIQNDLKVCILPVFETGNWTYDLGIASAMLYQLYI